MNATPRAFAFVGVILALCACGRTDPIAGASGAAGGGGAAGAGGAPVDPPAKINAVSRGAGCGKPLPSFQQETVPGTPKGYTHHTVMGTGATLAGTIPSKAGPRTFWVRVPADYDPNHAYRTVYLGQGCGDYESANLDTLPQYKESFGGTEQAIYVALDIPRDMANMDCYDNRAGLASQEWEAFDLFHAVVDASYCVDNNRVYIEGYNAGGYLANMWGCYFAGAPSPQRRFAPGAHVRAQVSIWGGEPLEQPACGGPVAALWFHGTVSSTSRPISESLAALARVGRMNGCDTTYDDADAFVPWHQDDPALASGFCRKFTGCPADYPVVFCAPNTPAQSGDMPSLTIPAITRFFDELPAPP